MLGLNVRLILAREQTVPGNKHLRTPLMEQSMRSDKEKPNEGRIAYPGMFVAVPMDAYEFGLLAELNGREIKQWLALLRAANQQSKRVGEKFQVSLKTLEQFGGASQRTAYRASRDLMARGVIWIEPKTSPFVYILNSPSEWRNRKGLPLVGCKQSLAPEWPR